MPIEQNPDANKIYAEQRCAQLVDESVALREENMVSQKQVALMLGLASHGNITLMEQHRSVPRLDRFLRILSVYGYTLQIIKKNTASPN